MDKGDSEQSHCGLFVVRAEGSRGTGPTTTSTTVVEKRSEADAIVDGMSFTELCDEFECISSPAVGANSTPVGKRSLRAAGR